MIFRMFAKIAHSYLVAQVGLAGFKPLVAEFILEHTGDIQYLIGGTEAPETITGEHYQLSYEIKEVSGRKYYVVSVRIFANKMAPTYLAVTGEAL